jgi:hypothetical protein
MATEIELAIGDPDYVRRNVGGDLPVLGRSDVYGSPAAVAQSVAQLGGPLQEPCVEIEYIRRIRFAPRRLS